MSNGKCIVVGASHAGTTLALQLRKEGWQGPITLIGAEQQLPYHRPPLSKDLLAGKKELDGVRLRPEQAFVDNDIELRLGESVKQIHAQERQIELASGELLDYAKLALCVGSSVRRLPLGENKDNVFYVRSADDSLRLREQIASGQKAVVIGAGYIGLEVASVLRASGLEVTVVEREATVLPRVAGPAVADYVQRLHEKNGVTFRFATEVSDLSGADRVSHVVCGSGEEIAADLVVIGVGILPNVQLAESAGLVINNGIQVDEFTQTSDPDIVAAGDCTCHPSQLYQRALRLESVQNANDQARVAAANLCGKKQAYDAVPWFWSDQYTTKLQSAGLLTGYDACVVRGDPAATESEGFAAFYLQAGKLLAADCVARPKEFMAVKQLLKTGATIAADALENESVEPASWLK